MTKKEKSDRVIHWLTTHHLFSQGGYPYDFDIHAGVVFVAGLDHDEASKLKRYDCDMLPKWYDAAVDYLIGSSSENLPEWPEFDGGDFGEWTSAFYETMPDDVDDS